MKPSFFSLLVFIILLAKKADTRMKVSDLAKDEKIQGLVLKKILRRAERSAGECSLFNRLAGRCDSGKEQKTDSVTAASPITAHQHSEETSPNQKTYPSERNLIDNTCSYWETISNKCQWPRRPWQSTGNQFAPVTPMRIPKTQPPQPLSNYPSYQNYPPHNPPAPLQDHAIFGNYLKPPTTTLPHVDSSVYLIFNGQMIPLQYDDLYKFIHSKPYFTPSTENSLPPTPNPTPAPEPEVVSVEIKVEEPPTTTTVVSTTTTSPTTTVYTVPIEKRIKDGLEMGAKHFQREMKSAAIVGVIAAVLTFLLLILLILFVRCLIVRRQRKRLDQYEVKAADEASTYKPPYGYPSYV